MTAQPCDCNKNHRTVHLKMENFMACELYFRFLKKVNYDPLVHLLKILCFYYFHVSLRFSTVTLSSPAGQDHLLRGPQLGKWRL